MPVFGQKPDTGHSPVRRRGSLWRISLVTFFVRAKKVTRRRRRDRETNRRRKRRIRRTLGALSAAAGTGAGRERFALRRDLLSLRGESRQRRAGGPFHKGPPDPSSRPKGLRPLWNPLRGFTGDGGRRTRFGKQKGVFNEWQYPSAAYR